MRQLSASQLSSGGRGTAQVMIPAPRPGTVLRLVYDALRTNCPNPISFTDLGVVISKRKGILNQLRTTYGLEIESVGHNEGRYRLTGEIGPNGDLIDLTKGIAS